MFEDLNEITHCYSIDIIFIYTRRFGRYIRSLALLESQLMSI